MNTAIRKPMMISNIINSVYLALLTLVGVSTWSVIQMGEQAVGTMMDQAGQADAESYMGGYQLVGNLMGAGTVSIFLLVLYFVLAVVVIYWVLFLGENISGYVVYSRLKHRTDGSLGKGPKVTFILKCVLSALVMIPAFFLLASEQWQFGLAVMLPQAVVLGLSIVGLRSLPSRRKNTAAEMEPGF